METLTKEARFIADVLFAGSSLAYLDGPITPVVMDLYTERRTGP